MYISDEAQYVNDAQGLMWQDITSETPIYLPSKCFKENNGEYDFAYEWILLHLQTNTKITLSPGNSEILLAFMDHDGREIDKYANDPILTIATIKDYTLPNLDFHLLINSVSLNCYIFG